MNVISNSSPLIAMSCLRRLDIFQQLFGQLWIPQMVYQEVVVQCPDPEEKAYLQHAVQEFITVVSPKTSRLFSRNLGPGERSVLNLALEMRPNVHTSRVPPQEERFVSLVSPIHEVQGPVGHIVIDGFHSFLGQWPGILDAAIRIGMDNSPGSEFFLEFSTFRVVDVLRLFLGIQMVQVAIEFVKAVIGGKVLVAVSQVVFPELSGHVSMAFQQTGNGRILFRHALFGTRKAHLGKAGPDRRLSC